MNRFNHVSVNLPKLETQTIDYKRFYITPEGEVYPSITTVLSIRKKEGLMKWRNKVGEQVANYVSGTAAARGTKVHHMCEDYLNNRHLNWPNEFEKHKRDFLPWCLFNQLKERVLNNINNIYVLESSLYSDKYKVAGRVDCVSEYNKIPSIIDFKTSTRERTDDWNENFYIQGAAYAEMFYERTGIEIKQIVILVVTEDGTVQEFIKEKEPYLNYLSEAIAAWKNQ